MVDMGGMVIIKCKQTRVSADLFLNNHIYCYNIFLWSVMQWCSSCASFIILKTPKATMSPWKYYGVRCIPNNWTILIMYKVKKNSSYYPVFPSAFGLSFNKKESTDFKIFLLSNVVIMYKCEKMPSSCGECLTQHEAFSCGWCKPSNQCSLQSSCTTKDSWLSKNENCPNPRILKVGYMNSNNYLKLVTHNVIQHQNHKVKLHTMLKSV